MNPEQATEISQQNHPEEEPFFIIWASDIFAATIVRLWANLTMMHRGPDEPWERAFELAEKMDNWPYSIMPDGEMVCRCEHPHDNCPVEDDDDD